MGNGHIKATTSNETWRIKRTNAWTFFPLYKLKKRRRRRRRGVSLPRLIMPRVLPRSCDWLAGRTRGESLNKIQEHGTSVRSVGPAALKLYLLDRLKVL